MSLLLAGGLVDGRRADVLVRGSTIAAVGPGLDPGDARVLELPGHRIVPGLHDHHLHLRGVAALADSVPAGPPEVGDRAALADALSAAAAARPGEWVRAVGYHESVAGPLDRRVLDLLGPEVPIRVQHRSGVTWTLNSLAIEALGLGGATDPGIERDPEGRPTGNLFRMDDWLRTVLPPRPLDFAPLSRRLAALGVTALTDATPGRDARDVAAFVEELAAGRILQRLVLMCPPDVEVPPLERLHRGPHKILLDDLTLPGPDALAEEVAWAHAGGSPVAVHCVTLVQLVVTLEALRSAGPIPGDRVEHGAVVLPEQFDVLRRLGVTVVTNPSFVAERGGVYLDEVESADRAHLYRCRSLIEAGVPVAGGTDAPFATADPWAAVEAATDRRTADGRTLGPAEAVDPRTALGLFLGHSDRPAVRRRVVPGAPADLCALCPTGRRAEMAGPAVGVSATVIGGELVHWCEP